MHRKTALSLLAVLALAASASAATVPLRLPSAFPALPLSLPGLGANLPSVILPSLPAPVAGPTLFPGVKSPLPLPVVTRLSAADDMVLDWSFLDDEDDGLAGVLVPADGGPKPLPPGTARAPLKFLSRAAEAVRIAPVEFFDHSARRADILVKVP